MYRKLHKNKGVIANSFAYESGGRRISNGPVEGFNSQYKKLMRVSNGLSNFQRFRAQLILCSRKEVVFSPPRRGTTRRRMGKKRGKYKRKGAQFKRLGPLIKFARFSKAP